MSDNSNVSATQIIEEVNNMRNAATGQKNIANNLKAEMAEAKATLESMKEMDGHECERTCIVKKDLDADPPNYGRDDVSYWKLEIHPDQSALEKAYRDFEIAHAQFESDYSSLMKVLDTAEKSAEEIAEQLNEITASLTEEKGKVENDDDDDEKVPLGGSPAGGSPAGGADSGGGGGYSPAYPTETPQPTERETDREDKTDYGDGDEGEEKEPTVTTPGITQVPTMPTIGPAKSSTSSASTTSGPVQQPATVTTTTTEQHSGGGYSGRGGYTPDSSETNETDSIEDAAASIDSVIGGNPFTKIPTSSAPIARVNTASRKSSGGSVIPITSGIATAAVLGIGAKAYLDKKKARQEDEDDEESDELLFDSF